MVSRQLQKAVAVAVAVAVAGVIPLVTAVRLRCALCGEIRICFSSQASRVRAAVNA
jgi:hypothetical protein